MFRMGIRFTTWSIARFERSIYSYGSLDSVTYNLIIMNDGITILAIELYGYPELPDSQSRLLAECQGKRFYVDFSLTTELINDRDFNLVLYLNGLARKCFDRLKIVT